ncbi:ATP-dependent DNA ligase [Streptomyces bohaiensis]|uniref:DNA ligase (ATP) n=1 Tax=Streptomyces bohaiensis TaxID=1431344 RepID=A0ABX1C596_9ACTN|nr:ATP-dependent DNA ligase [Streptomyces bohaiensis]NJQ14386.1 ATP-dependent DNA ligase [Streptomyces bohaiensis]
MDLPVMPPVLPMLARAADRIPEGMSYEAKWDGYRALVFRDGDEVEIGSRTGKSLGRYFPELLPALRDNLPNRCVTDGEIVVARDGHLDFDALQERIHPAESRVRRLAAEIPASYICFDLLALDRTSLLAEPFRERRALLTEALREAAPPVHLAPATDDRRLAQRWFEEFEGAGIDGVVAKRPDAPYRPAERTMIKIKHERTADCVVAGIRPHKSGPVVGSLLLGLYDERGRLQQVGACGAFPMRRRAELMEELRPLLMDEDTTGHPWADWRNAEAHVRDRMPGTPHRWSGQKDASWLPLRPERVCEVAYDHLQGDRFRHTAQFRRWREDRTPESCTYAQLDRPAGPDLGAVLG